jgi:hypothetical protein
LIKTLQKKTRTKQSYFTRHNQFQEVKISHRLKNTCKKKKKQKGNEKQQGLETVAPAWFLMLKKKGNPHIQKIRK